MLRRVNLAERNSSIGEAGRWIEHAQLKTCAEKACERGVQIGLTHEVFMDSLDEGGKSLALAESALEIGAGFHRGRSCVRHVGRIMMPSIDIGNGSAIADHISIEPPGVAQVIPQKHRVSTCRRTSPTERALHLPPHETPEGKYLQDRVVTHPH